MEVSLSGMHLGSARDELEPQPHCSQVMDPFLTLVRCVEE